MCGIAGAVGTIDDSVMRGMARCSEFQAHRGPDADGSWRSEPSGPGAAFFHRRLAIIDLSAAGRQPMLDATTGNVLCFNGEIYNFRKLRAELESLGHAFETSSTDSEVILKAYTQWGQDCVDHLHGMFAFSIWDARLRGVLIARDRVGVKPLYLSEVARPGGGRVTLFASEIRGILESGLVERRISEVGLSTYLWNGFVNGSDTIAEGIRSFPAGHTAWIDANGAVHDEHAYWQLPASASTHAQVGADAVLASCLREAVEDRLIADVPLGVFLSGGIDSSAMAALASRCSPGVVRTFNISFDEASFDEAPYARAVAEHLGTEHHEIRLDEARFASQLESALGSLDQPTFDGINTYFVSRAVREAGITVAISGAGGDELFGGYKSFIDIPRAAHWARDLRPVPIPLLRALARVATRIKTGRAGAVPPQTRWGKLGDALSTRGDLGQVYQVSYGLFSSEFLAQLSGLDHDPTRYGLAPRDASARATRWHGAPELHAISTLELQNFVGERLLRDTDTASMAVALEVRVPLLDHRVIEAAAAMDEAMRYEPLGRKGALRRNGLGDLPAEIFERPKSGFVLPLEPWSRNALKGEIDTIFRDRAHCEASGLDPDAVLRLWDAHQAGAPGMYWSRIWALFVLLHWTRSHGLAIG